MRDLLGFGACLAMVAGLVVFMAWQSRIPADRPDPTCDLSHQALAVNLNLDFLGRRQSSLLWQVRTVCDLYSDPPLPPPAEPIPGP